MLLSTKMVSERVFQDLVETSNFNLDDMDLSDLPSSIITQFEELFSELNPEKFVYFPNFRRVKVDFGDSTEAARARIFFHDYKFNDKTIRTFFAQQVNHESESSPRIALEPPEPEKMFLISPPASPPVDWKPVVEGVPVINHELISTLATLQPGSSHEIHPGCDQTPKILLHTSEEMSYKPAHRQKIQQTRRPNFQG